VTAFDVDGRGCLNKHQPPLHVHRVCGTRWQAFECDTNYYPPVAVILLLTLTALSAAIADNAHYLRGRYRDMNTMWYVFNIAIFDMMWCIVPSLLIVQFLILKVMASAEYTFW